MTYGMIADGSPYTDGNADEFMAVYAAGSNVTVEALKERGRQPFYCSGCNDYDFPHWEMGRVTDDAFDRRNQIEAPR